MARLQKTPIAADPLRVRRIAEVLEPTLEGEIAIHRRRAAARDIGPAQSAPRPPAAPAPASGPPPLAPPRLEEFARIEDYLRAYLEDERFRATHPLACGRWIVAWEMLWCADSRAKLIAVGQRAVEAMQAFGASLLEAWPPPATQTPWPELLAQPARRTDPLDVVARVSRDHAEQLGEERSELLDSLIEHWRALAESVREHEHGSTPGRGRLRWEHGRRLVLFTALVMVEVDRSFA